MFRLGQTGIAAVVVVVIVAASAGGAVATPVVVDVVDVDPDSPFYGLERLGEQIRMIGNEDRMRERWGEYASMVDRGMGTTHKSILEEFIDEMRDVIPDDNVEAKQEIVRWMQEQMPGIGLVKLKLARELGEKLKDEFEDDPDEFEDVEDDMEALENLEQQLLTNLGPEIQEIIRARLELIMAHLENHVERHRMRIGESFDEYFDIENVLDSVDVRVRVEVRINIERPITISTTEFEEELADFNESLAEVQLMLEGVPENIRGGNAARQQVLVAIDLRDKAVAAIENEKIRRAIALIESAEIHLKNAERILEFASEWEPEFSEEWETWRGAWENLREHWMEEGIWENIMENHPRFAEEIMHQWEEQWEREREERHGMMEQLEEEEED